MRSKPPILLMALVIGYPGLPLWIPKESKLSQINPVNPSVHLLRGSTTRNEWIPERSAAEMRQQYLDLIRDFESKSAYRLSGRDEEIRQYQARRRFARYVMLRVGGQRASREFKRIDQRNDGTVSQAVRSYRQTVRRLRQPVTVSAGTPDIRYGSSVNWLEGIGDVWLKSALFDVEIRYHPEEHPLPTRMRKRLEAFDEYELWKVIVSRSLPLKGANLRLVYASTSANFQFVLENALSADLRSEYKFATGAGRASPGDHTVSLHYAIRI